MNDVINNIIGEWFYRLPDGYANPPYTEEQLKVLGTVLNEYGFTNWPSILSFLSEKEKISTEPEEQDNEEETKPEREAETHESNADFRNLLDSYETFSDVINRRYVVTGIDIGDLNPLYDNLLSQPDSIQDQLRRIIGKRTYRDIYNGTFKMGQYEKILYDVLRHQGMTGNVNPDVLWLAFVLDGKIKGTNVGNKFIDGNLIIDNSDVLAQNFANQTISFGALPAEPSSILTVILKLSEVIDGQQITDLTKSAVNIVLDKITDEENKQELEQFLNLSNTTKLAALKSLSSDIKTALENQNLNELPIKFCSLFDAYISSVLAKIQYFVDVKHGDMVYIVQGKELYPALNCTKEYKLGGGIFSLTDMAVHIDGNIIDAKLS